MIYNDAELEVRKNLAATIDTPVEILQQLSEDTEAEVRHLVAGNPNTPIEVLQKLGGEFPEAVTANPVFNLLALENPESRFIKLLLARSSTTSEETLAKLVQIEAGNEEILCAVAKNTSTPIHILEKLSTCKTSLYPDELDFVDVYSGTKVHVTVAANPKTPLSLLEKMSSHVSCIVRANIANHHNVTPELLDMLAKSKERNVLLVVARNYKTTASTLEYLAAKSDKDIRMAVLQHANVSEIAKEIAEIMEKAVIDSVTVVNKIEYNDRLDFIV